MLTLYGREEMQKVFESFQPVHESETATFLRDKAIEMELRDVSRTYLAISDDIKVLGFITLSIKCMVMPEENLLSGKTLKKMNIELRTGTVQSYLIGQLSRSKDAPKGIGRELLDIAFDHLRSAKKLVGCRMVRLDCRDELVQYYTDYGFKRVSVNQDGYHQMMALITTEE